MSEVVRFSEAGLPLADAREAIDAMRGLSFTNRLTGISARLSSSAKGKLVSNKATGKSKANGFTREQHNAMAARVVEAIKLETLDRIVEVVSGNTPHASSVPLRQMIAKADDTVNGGAS